MRTTKAIAAAYTVILVSLCGCAPAHTRNTLAFAPRADVMVTSSPNTEVLIYASTPSQFALRGQPLQTRTDTIRTITPVQFEAYLDAGEIHVSSTTGVPVTVEAAMAHAPATRAIAKARHVVVDAAGAGIHTLE